MLTSEQLDRAGRIALEAAVLAAATPGGSRKSREHIMAKFRDTLIIGMIRQYLAGRPELRTDRRRGIGRPAP